MRPGGTISIIGQLSGGKGEIDVTPILMRNLRLQGVFVGARDEFEAMNRAIVNRKLKPVVDKVFPLSDARAAFEHMGAAKHFGKVCISLE